MPQLDFDGANSKISADKIQGQSGTTVTIPAGHNLAGDGSGLTSLPAANLTGTVADARISTLTASKLTGALPAIDGSNLTGVSGGGKCLAVVQSIKTDTHSTTSATPVTTGLAVTTGTLTSGSKVLIQVTINMGNSTSEQRTQCSLWNGATQLFLGDSGTGHQSSAWFRSWQQYAIYNISFMYLHSPGVTTAQTYTVKFNASSGDTITQWINRAHGESGDSGRTASSITAMEIGA